MVTDLPTTARLFCAAYVRGQKARAIAESVDPGNVWGEVWNAADAEFRNALQAGEQTDDGRALFEYGFMTGWYDCDGDNVPAGVPFGRKMLARMRRHV